MFLNWQCHLNNNYYEWNLLDFFWWVIFKMVYSIAKKQEIVCLFVENNYNASATRRVYAARHPNGKSPTRRTIKNIFTKFRITSNLQRKKRKINENTENHNLNILLNYVENPSKSVRTTSQEMRARYGPKRTSREYIRNV